MKGIFLKGPNDFALQELEEPSAGKKDVLIQVDMAGICASDIHLLHGRNPFANYPLIPGHEYMGTVLKAPAQSGLKKGDRVTVFPEEGCGKCPACKKGRYIHCPEFKFVGVHLPGGCFCERVAVPYRRVIPLPRTMSKEMGATVEPTAVGVHAVKRGEMKRGAKVVVIGGGTIGLLTAQVARALGASKVVISEPIEERRRIAGALGFRLVCDPQEVNLASYVKEKVGWVDVVFDVVSTPRTIEDGLTMLGPNGTLVMVGLPHIEGLGIPYRPIFARELKVVGTRTYFMEDFRTAIRLLMQKKVRSEPLISAIMQLDEFLTALERLEKEPEKYVKILIQPT
jgi:2-desacetyl-2-hydroxyethyl bacteriochlorophyllide A dehydrogenase